VRTLLNERLGLKLCALSSLCFTLLVLVLPGDQLDQLSNSFWQLLGRDLQHDGPGILNDKLVHGLLFFCCAISNVLAWVEDAFGLWVTLIALAVLGATTEILQYFAPGRSMSALDWLADLVGVVFGALLARRLQLRVIGR